jgi:hypothetical protein
MFKPVSEEFQRFVWYDPITDNCEPSAGIDQDVGESQRTIHQRLNGFFIISTRRPRVASSNFAGPKYTTTPLQARQKILRGETASSRAATGPALRFFNIVTRVQHVSQLLHSRQKCPLEVRPERFSGTHAESVLRATIEMSRPVSILIVRADVGSS